MRSLKELGDFSICIFRTKIAIYFRIARTLRHLNILNSSKPSYRNCHFYVKGMRIRKTEWIEPKDEELTCRTAPWISPGTWFALYMRCLAIMM